MTRSDSETATIEFDVKPVAELVRRCRRGTWLVFLALALLTVSFPSATGLIVAGSPAITSRPIDKLAILRQDTPSNPTLDSRSMPGWWRATERSGAVQSPGGYGIVPAGVQIAASRPLPITPRSVHDVVDLPGLRHFDAQAPPRQ